MSSIQGQFLVASPYLSDPNFFRTVVLMIEHNEDGAFGLVLNRPARHTVQSMWKQTMELECRVTAPVYVGGPIAGPVMVLHNLEEESDLPVIPEVHFASHREKILRLIDAPPNQLRVFNGYSGWGAGQLDQELEQGGWLTAAATAEKVFHLPADMIWQHLTREIGQEITLESLRISGPENPSWN